MESKDYLYMHDESFTLYQGKMQEVLSTFEKASIDSIVCDPPYELNFMGKGWDNQGIAFQPDTWKHCYDVLKPGGYLLAFGGSRTFHRIACAIEDAGFEIRDCIMWLYGSGFPKSQNIGLAIDKKLGLQGQRGIGGFNVGGIQEQQNRKAKLYIGSTTDGSKKEAYTDYKSEEAKQWQGWGSCLKPAYEPIIVARKPFKGSLVDNVLAYGVGGLNIDECRISTSDDLARINKTDNGMFGFGNNNNNKAQQCKEQGIEYGGRFPANVIHDGSDEVMQGFPTNDKPNGSLTKKYECNNDIYSPMPPRNEFDSFNDTGSASRYFYCAKASKKDRDEGLDMFEEKQTTDGCIRANSDTARMFGANSISKKNIHPTVKPVELMQYLVRLVSPKGAIVLDCFMGSGSTGKAVMFENRERDANYHFIGIEMTEEYLPICKTRIDYAKNKYEYEQIKEAEILKEQGITTIFDFMEE